MGHRRYSNSMTWFGGVPRGQPPGTRFPWYSRGNSQFGIRPRGYGVTLTRHLADVEVGASNIRQ